MKSTTSRILTGVAFAAALGVSSASAQPPMRVVGKVASVANNVVDVKDAKGADMQVHVPDNLAVMTVSKGTIADIKKGSYVGVGASPQADGSQKAIRVVVFAESQRGTGEGFRPWDQPNTTMTNATVDTTVANVDGQVLTVKYKDGEKKIIIGSDAVILVNAPGDKSEVKAGANVAFPAVTKKADGTLEANRVNVGAGDVRP
jgi:hypothetical protein